MSVHKRFYAAAAEEQSAGVTDEALMVKAMVQTGNESDARRIYLQWRAEELAASAARERIKTLWSLLSVRWKRRGQLAHAVDYTLRSPPERRPELLKSVFLVASALCLLGVVVYLQWNKSPVGFRASHAHARASAGSGVKFAYNPTTNELMVGNRIFPENVRTWDQAAHLDPATVQQMPRDKVKRMGFVPITQERLKTLMRYVHGGRSASTKD